MSMPENPVREMIVSQRAGDFGAHLVDGSRQEHDSVHGFIRTARYPVYQIHCVPLSNGDL